MAAGLPRPRNLVSGYLAESSRRSTDAAAVEPSAAAVAIILTLPGYDAKSPTASSPRRAVCIAVGDFASYPGKVRMIATAAAVEHAAAQPHLGGAARRRPPHDGRRSGGRGAPHPARRERVHGLPHARAPREPRPCLLYTSDAADE